MTNLRDTEDGINEAGWEAEMLSTQWLCKVCGEHCTEDQCPCGGTMAQLPDTTGASQMDYVYTVIRRGCGDLMGIYCDLDSIPDRYMHADDEFGVQKIVIYGTPHAWALVERGDLDPTVMRKEKG